MKRLIPLCLLALAGLCVMSISRLSAATPKRQTASNDKADIQRVIDRFAVALRAKDIDGCMSIYAPDVVAFDIVPPLQYKGKDAYRADFVKVFDLYQGPLEVEFRDVSITAGDTVAFSHTLERIGGTIKSGDKSDMWVRCTDCYSKINGKWLVVHEHVSVPTDFETGKAVVDLKP